MPILRKRDDSPWVSQVQQVLKDQGFYNGAVDADFGDATEIALRKFQLSRHMLVSGTLDAASAQALKLDHLVGPVHSATPESAALLFPGTRFENVEHNLPIVCEALVGGDLTDKKMLLMALATIRVETARFLPISEGVSVLNTSPGGSSFDKYDNRRDLGNEGPPDGERYKGRGYVQLTGRANYADISERIGLGADLVMDPERANEPSVAGRILAAFLKRAEPEIRAALVHNDLAAARRLVNGGSHGLNPFRTAFLRGEEIYSDDLVVGA